MRKASSCFNAFLIASTSMIVCLSISAWGQRDPIRKGSNTVKEDTNGKVTITVEERTRWEEKYGVNFGKDVNQQYLLSRIRVGMVYRPNAWLTISGMGQDARAPFYAGTAPATIRDSMDLQESYVSLGAPAAPVNFSAGRRMIDYGETRVFGIPQWTNSSRSFDYARFEYPASKMMLDLILVSPVIVLPDSFNTPELGNRFWGTYDVFPQLWRGMSLDAYALRHSQNKIGGWIGAGSLGTNSYGARLYGRLPSSFNYSLEGIGQNGHLGNLDQRAYAGFSNVSRTASIGGVPLIVSAEYKEASGSHSGSNHSATFDQLAPANHDKFGHMDLFGWRNLKTFKTLETLSFTKSVGFNVMYTDEFLFSASDALYNSAGSKISISGKGTAGTRVGQELDSFLTLRAGSHTFYAGFGHFFKGQFVQSTTPGINPRYFYIAQQYSLK